MSPAESVARRWRLGLWLSLGLSLAALLTLLPYMTSSAELVRMRNALLLDDRHDAALVWVPPAYPPDFKTEQAPVPRVFSDAVRRLNLEAMPSDWERAVAISDHLLASSAELTGDPIQSGLLETYQRITARGDGYCGDFVRAFTALAVAAGMPMRAWAFSFDGFGGHGHVWVEIWNRQRQAWQLLDVFDNYYFVLDGEQPLSALAFRQALASKQAGLGMRRLSARARPGYVIEAKAWDYFRRGLPEWYLWWGTNVLSVDADPWVRGLGKLSRSLEQLAAIAVGVHPHLVVLSAPENQAQHAELRRVRSQLAMVGATVAVLLVGAGVCAWQLQRIKRRDRNGGTYA